MHAVAVLFEPVTIERSTGKPLPSRPRTESMGNHAPRLAITCLTPGLERTDVSRALTSQTRASH